MLMTDNSIASFNNRMMHYEVMLCEVHYVKCLEKEEFKEIVSNEIRKHHPLMRVGWNAEWSFIQVLNIILL